MISYLPPTAGPTVLPSADGGIERVHKFDGRSIAAVNAALAAGRPLLIRGEPGVGKTQLAEAAAQELGRLFYRHVVDSRTESRDLLYEFEAVMRLAEAQLCGAQGVDEKKARDRLNILKFVVPGPLWWAFNSKNAKAHVETNEVCTALDPLKNQNEKLLKNGWVVLIDEIDKAESDVPNGLLEALGSGGFRPMGYTDRIEMSAPAPLVMITTNEERILPDAFVRRCVVLHLRLPKDSAELKKLLVARGEAHFKGCKVLEAAADILAQDRQTAIDRNWKPYPGQAEYLDLLRAVIRQHPDDTEKQKELLSTVANYVVRKPAEMQEQNEQPQTDPSEETV